MSLAQNTALNIGLLDEPPRQSCEKWNSAHKKGIGGSEGLPVGSDHIGVCSHMHSHMHMCTNRSVLLHTISTPVQYVLGRTCMGIGYEECQEAQRWTTLAFAL